MIRSGHTKATYLYAHHMGSGERVPAMAWATCKQGRVELSGDAYPALEPRELEAKAVAIMRNRLRGRFGAPSLQDAKE